MLVDAAAPWVIVVPLKSGTTTKSRLAEFSPAQRLELARAFAQDCTAAALRTDGVAAVLVVTDDEVAGNRLRQHGCTVVPDRPAGGLNAAVRHGADVARSRWRGCRIAVLLSDLPALRSSDLAQTLRAASRHRRAFVPDAAATGTTLLAARPGVDLDPRFEGASCAAHLASGAELLQIPCPTLRADVDDSTTLAAARALGVGPATLAVLATIEGR